MLSSIASVTKLKPRKEFITSDGQKYYTAYDAQKHECYLTIERMFGDVAIHDGINKKKGHKYFFLSRHLALETGIYRICVKNEDEMEALDFFFTGIYEKMGSPNTFPVIVNLEIYEQDLDGMSVVNEVALWRIYDRKLYQH